MKKMTNKALEVAMELVEKMFALFIGRRVNINDDDFPAGKLAEEVVEHLDPATKADLVKQANRYGWFDRFFFRTVQRPHLTGSATPLLWGRDGGTDEDMVEELLRGLIAEALFLTVRFKFLETPEPVNIARPGDEPQWCMPGKYVTLTESWLEEHRDWLLKRMSHYMAAIWKDPTCEWAKDERPPKGKDAYVVAVYPNDLHGLLSDVNRAMRYDPDDLYPAYDDEEEDDDGWGEDGWGDIDWEDEL